MNTLELITSIDLNYSEKKHEILDLYTQLLISYKGPKRYVHSRDAEETFCPTWWVHQIRLKYQIGQSGTDKAIYHEAVDSINPALTMLVLWLVVILSALIDCLPTTLHR